MNSGFGLIAKPGCPARGLAGLAGCPARGRLENSERLLSSVISMKATHGEKLELILSKLDEIGELLDSKSNDRFLSHIHREILRVLSDACTDSLFKPIEHGAIALTLDIEKADCLEAATLLENLGYLKILSGTKSRAIQITAKGYLKNQEELGEGASEMAKRVVTALPPLGQIKRTGAIATDANVGLVFVEALLNIWDKLNFIKLESGKSHFSMSLVRDVKQILLKDERLHQLSRLTKSST